MRFPSIKDVTFQVYSYVRDLKEWHIEEGDVRLQVYPDCGWVVRTGDSSYDQDHRGYWGASSVSNTTTKTECRAIARELIEQAKDHHSQAE